MDRRLQVKLLNYIQELHTSTRRDFIGRMNDNKVEAMLKARQHDFDYWDGDRRYGYGGYKYIPGRWENFAKKLIQDYGLNNSSKVLDIGMGKGYLLYELQRLLPGIRLYGTDISSYAINHKHPELKGDFRVQAASKLDYSDKEFDLVICINVLPILNLKDCISTFSEIMRISNRQYVVIETYRNEQEFFNLECWTLSAHLLLSIDDWFEIFRLSNYQGDYEWIFFE